MKNRKFVEIKSADVGRLTLRAFDRTWPTIFLPPGQKIARSDVGKRVYLDRETLTMETAEQFRARQEGGARSAAGKLTRKEEAAKLAFIRACETLLLDLDAEAVGRIADYVGEHGTDGDGGVIEDGAIVEALNAIVDAMARRRE